MRRSLVVAAVLVAAVSATPATASPSRVQWGTCPADAAVPGLECASVEVPLDYRNPGGARIQVAISRLASKNPWQRRGVLLFNQGGPGAPGLAYAAWAALFLPQSVRDRYDLIGFDPRGIGHSAPVACRLKSDQVPNVPPYARDAADVEKRAVVAKQIAQECASSPTAPELPYITTANTARDMDRIRAALGEPKVSYYGVSYGTYLGAVYASLFPSRTDRFVLDSNTGPGGFDLTGFRRFGPGMQGRFPDFAKWLAARNGTYGLGATPEQVTAKYFELAGRLDRQPLPIIDGANFRLLTFNELYYDYRFAELAQGWVSIDRGTTGPAPPQPDLDNVFSAQLHVVCNDSAWPRSVGTYQQHVAVDRTLFPMLGPSAANIWPCAFWPVRPEPSVRISPDGPTNVLMVQNLRDPATPFFGALEMRAALGNRARFVGVDQGGHGVLIGAGNRCGVTAITGYLAGAALSGDSFCGAEPAQAPTPDQRRALDRIHEVPLLF